MSRCGETDRRGELGGVYLVGGDTCRLEAGLRWSPKAVAVGQRRRSVTLRWVVEACWVKATQSSESALPSSCRPLDPPRVGAKPATCVLCPRTCPHALAPCTPRCLPPSRSSSPRPPRSLQTSTPAPTPGQSSSQTPTGPGDASPYHTSRPPHSASLNSSRPGSAAGGGPANTAKHKHRLGSSRAAPGGPRRSARGTWPSSVRGKSSASPAFLATSGRPSSGSRSSATGGPSATAHGTRSRWRQRRSGACRGRGSRRGRSAGTLPRPKLPSPPAPPPRRSALLRPLHPRKSPLRPQPLCPSRRRTRRPPPRGKAAHPAPLRSRLSRQSTRQGAKSVRPHRGESHRHSRWRGTQRRVSSVTATAAATRTTRS